MITCPKCNKELGDDTKFCDSCGAQIFETVFCPNCGEKTSSEFAFCQKCGAAVSEDTPQSVAEDGASFGETIKEGKNLLKALPRKTLIIGGIALVAVVAIILAISLLSGGTKKNEFCLYLKDNEIVYTDFSEDGKIDITTRLMSGTVIDGSDSSYLGSALGHLIAFSEDGNRIFYPDRVDDDADGITLYYRDLDKPEKEPFKIDSDVMQYAINKNGTKVIYTKGEDQILYIHDLTDKEKIASDVVSFDVADDCKKIGYLTEKESYYLWSADSDAVKLASDVSSVEYVSYDMSTLYYIKDDSLYKVTVEEEDKVKIASEVSRVVSIYETGEIYYTKADVSELSLMDYVDDDFADIDANILQPGRPDYPAQPSYPYFWDYATTEAFEAAKAQYNIDLAAYNSQCDQLEAEYHAELEAYYDKRDRDNLRTALQDETLAHTDVTLYYFDGNTETAITDSLCTDWSVSCAADKPVAYFRAYNQADVENVKLSEVTSKYDVRDMVEAALYSANELHIAVGGTTSIVDQNEASTLYMPFDGSALYFTDDVSDDGYCDLYKVLITDGVPAAPEMYDSDVYASEIMISGNDFISYYKNVDTEDWHGDLYVNGEEIDYDVHVSRVTNMDGAVYYYTDWNSNKSYGTLKKSTDGEKVKIADDVHDFMFAQGNLVYLYDYSTNHYTGTLYQYNNGNPEKIDDDVSALIPYYNTTIKGARYFGW